MRGEAYGRRQESQGGLRLGGDRIRELPEEHVLRRALNQKYRGQPAWRRDFLEAAEGEAESAQRGGRRPWPHQDGKCALCGCGLTGTCGV